MLTRYSIYFTASVLCVASAGSANAEPVNEKTPVREHGSLLSPDRSESAGAFRSVNEQAHVMRDNVTEALVHALKHHRDDKTYDSPLHRSLNAVGNLRIYEAERALISIVDYEIEERTVPPGRYVTGEFFFPAAAALVEVRADTGKIVEAISGDGKTDKEIQLLTWVCASRAGSLDEAKRMLDSRDHTPGTMKALALLAGAKSTADLLP